MSNNVDLDETVHYDPSHLDLHCLQKSIIIACGSERVKCSDRMANNVGLIKLLGTLFSKAYPSCGFRVTAVFCLVKF